MPVVELVQAQAPAEVATARELFCEYACAIGVDLEYQGFSAELAALPDPYAPPHGALLIARSGDTVAGCVALRPLGDGIAEMKRLYVRDAFRGSGLGRRLVEAVIARARETGHRELRLDTLPTMRAAQELYRRLGFREIAPYNDAHLPGTRFFARMLADAPIGTQR
jgi:putative acetyltransferase